MYQPLTDHLHRFISLNEDELQLLHSKLQYRNVNNKEFLLKEGQVCGALYFIVKGCFRMYTITDSGTEQIIQFAIDNWWITDYTSLDTKKASMFNIQAVEHSEVIVLEKHIQEELFEEIPKLERYFRLILQRAYAATLMRIQYIFNQSGEERYHHFNSLFPDFVQRIPQYMLASYLGFTPEFLSKIRARRG